MVDPRKAAAATGGAIWFYGGYGNPPQKQIGPNSWGAAEGEYRKLADAVQKTAEEEGKSVDSANPEEVLDWLGDEPVWVELTPEGTVVPVPEPDPEAWVPDPDAVPEVVPEVVPPAVGGSLLMEGLGAELGGRLAGFPPTDMDTPLAPAEPPGQGIEDMESGVAAHPELPIGWMQGLTADEAFQQHHATSGAGAMGGMNAARRINPNQGELPGTGGPAEEIRRQIKEAKEQVQPRTPEEQAAWEKASREKGHRSPAPVVPPPVPPPVNQMEDRNPELRSMDSQMLADLMAQQATQPEQGYFGGMGEAVQGLTNRVAGMSGQERAALIAALVAAGLLTAGSGGMLAPAGAALMGGAGMAALSQ